MSSGPLVVEAAAQAVSGGASQSASGANASASINSVPTGVSVVPLQIGALSVMASPVSAGILPTLPNIAAAAGVTPVAINAAAVPTALVVPTAKKNAPTVSAASTANGSLKAAVTDLSAPEAKAEAVLGALFENSRSDTGDLVVVRGAENFRGSLLKKSAAGESGASESGKRPAARVRPGQRTYKSPEGNEAKMLAQLTKSLEENHLPAYKTAKAKLPGGETSRPTVVILAPASRHKVAIAREGGKQSAGDVHLVMDASWLIQERHADGRTTLLVKKGVTFDEKGQATVVEYEKPLKARYFANYFTLGSNDRADGVPFEENLDVPQSNSLQLEKIVNDKLGTRLMMAARGVAVPSTLAFLMPQHHLSDQVAQFQSAESAGVSAVSMPVGEAKAAEVARRVSEFLDGYEGEEIVVKPSGPQFHSGRGVKFFKKSEREAIISHALALSVDPMMTQDGAVLVDSRVNSAPLNRGGRKMETTLRVLAARAPWNGGVTTGIFARVGPWGKPTTAEAADPRDNATVEPWSDLLAEWKKSALLDEGTARELDRQLREMGAAALEAIAAGEKSRPRTAGEPYQAQTDLVGLDVMIERRGDKLVPVVIEVNDHDSGGQYNMDLMRPDRPGEHSREWIATMLQRARRDILKGKRIVLVGAGYAGKRFIFEKAKQLGVEIVLVDARTPFVADLLRDGLVSELIETDNTKPKEALAAARKKLQKSVSRDGAIDGITSFWEDDVPLTADLAKALGLPYHTQNAAKSVRSKAETRRVMSETGLPTPEFVRISLPVRPKALDAEYLAKVAAARALFEGSLEKVGFPAVVKPAFGAAAMGVKKATNKAEAMAAFDEILKVVDPLVDPIFAQGGDLVLEQYLDGREYDVDIVMLGGKPLFVSVTDNWPTREPYFLATGSSLPTRRLNKKEESEAGDLAVKTAQALGLTDGVIHIEGKYTKNGARIVEANGRMGGEYVHDWVEAVWGVSLVEEGFMAATAIQGKPFKAVTPLTYLEGEFLIPTKSGVIKKFALSDEAREQPGFHELRIKKQVGDRIAVPPVGYERAGMLVARGATKDEARRNLDALRAKLILEIRKDGGAK